MRTKVFLTLCCISLLAGCSVDQRYIERRCGSLNTQAIKDDIVSGFRTDREWYERLILGTTWQLDCERSVLKHGY